MKHLCHWEGCTKEVPPKLWGCIEHWSQLPKDLRDAIWREYKPGQEIRKDPSAAYMKVIAEVDKFVRAQNERRKGKLI